VDHLADEADIVDIVLSRAAAAGPSVPRGEDAAGEAGVAVGEDDDEAGSLGVEISRYFESSAW